MAEELLRDELEAQLIRKAWSDDNFKQQLIDNPKSAIEAEFGQSVSEDIQIVVVDESQGKLGLVIPTQPVESKNGELSDEQLEGVAGGGKFSEVKLSLKSWRKQVSFSGYASSMGRGAASTNAYPDFWKPAPDDMLGGGGLANANYPDTWGGE